MCVRARVNPLLVLRLLMTNTHTILPHHTFPSPFSPLSKPPRTHTLSQKYTVLAPGEVEGSRIMIHTSHLHVLCLCISAILFTAQTCTLHPRKHLAPLCSAGIVGYGREGGGESEEVLVLQLRLRGAGPVPRGYGTPPSPAVRAANQDASGTGAPAESRRLTHATPQASQRCNRALRAP